MMKFNVYQQGKPFERGEHWDANVSYVFAVDAPTATAAIRVAKQAAAFRVATGLARFPMVRES